MQFPRLEGSLKNGILRETYVTNCIDELKNKSDSINLFVKMRTNDYDWEIMKTIDERLEAEHYTLKRVFDFGKAPKVIISVVKRPIDFKISTVKDINLIFKFS